MKFSYSWLKQYLETNSSPQKIAEKLVDIGLEVESLDDPSLRLQGFVYAHVVKHEKHPNADRLSLCKVDIGGSELIQVVCGAPNVKANMGIAFAVVGTIIPVTGEALKKGSIRSVESYGMICSARELLLGEESDGIMDLGFEHKPGTPLAEIISTDAIFDVAITPNRGDCFGVYGIARDLAAAGLGTLKKPEIQIIAENGSTPSVSVLTPFCTQFSLRKISGVRNGESLITIQNLLKSSGQKAISRLVDITNYFCIGFARPMHVFDADKIKGNLVVREAKAGEILHALNDQDYVLSEGMIVIADDSSILSLAGIMGGRDTAVDANTTNVLLESAVFDPVAITKAGQSLNLVSDSRQRFERGVDADMILPCLDMATQMIMDQCGGVPAVKSYHASHVSKIVIDLDPMNVEKLLGSNINSAEIIEILEKLGCEIEVGDLLKIKSPTWRHDLTIAEDLIEEIARIKGYNHIHAQSLTLIHSTPITSRESIARQQLVSRGFLETLNWSFIDKTTAELFSGNKENLVSLANPIAQDLSVMRPSLLTSLLKIAIFNNANARENGAIFEIAPVHGSHLPDKQTICIAGLRFGNNHDKHWLDLERKVDVFDVKADALAVLKSLGVQEGSIQITNEAPSYFHPGRKGAFKQGNRVLAYFGEIHPLLTDSLNVVAFEIFYDNIHNAKPRKIQNTLSDLMPVRRDFAFVLDVSTSAEKLIKVVEKSSNLIAKIDIFDCYQGAHVEIGKKSLAISITLQPVDKTLDEESLTQIHNAVISAANKIGAELR